MRRICRTSFLFLPLLAIVLALGLGANPASSAAAGWHSPSISPTPRSVQQVHGEVELPSEVALVTGGHADPAAVDLVTAVLRERGMRTTRGAAPVSVTVGTGGDGAVGEALKSLNVAGPKGIPAQGYVFAAGQGGDGRGRIVLAGVDGAGTYYAAQTFRQVLDQQQGRVVPGVKVRDWPSFPLRGGMESFYGPTWSWDDRYDQVDFLAAHKMNYFFFGPANDLRTGTSWDKPYSADDLKKFAELVRYAADRHITFIYRISPEAPLDPSQGICHSAKDDRDKLIARFQQLYDIGVRRYVIAWDDVNGNFACTADQDAYGNDPQPLAAAQAAVLNDVQARFFDAHPDIEPVITVPTEYWGTTSTPYRTRFDDLTTTKMQVYWTGPQVVSAKITSADVEATQAAFPKHHLVIWDNYPVNDYATNRLFVGPLVARDAALADHTLGITFNEMIQQAPSQLALWTQADFAWNPGAYDAQRSWNAAVDGLGGKTAQWLRVFAENNRSNASIGGELAQEGPTLTPLVSVLTSAYTSGQSVDGPTADLSRYLAVMRQTPDRLRKDLANRLFAPEAEPWFGQFETAAAAGQDAVKALSAQAAGRGADLWQARLSLDEHRKALASNPQIVAPGVLDPLLGLAQSESDSWFGLPWYGGVGQPTGGPPPADGSSLAAATDDRLDTAYRAGRGPTAGESLEVPLTQSRPLQDVVVLRAPDDTSTGTVQARHEGRWVDLGKLRGAYTVVPGSDTTADAVRIAWDAGTHAPTVYEVVPRYADAFTGKMDVPKQELVARGKTFKIDVDVSGIAPTSVSGTLGVAAPDGWQASPASQPLNLPSDGRTVRHTYPIEVTVPQDATGDHTLTVSITAPGVQPVTAQVPVRVGSVADVPYANMVKEDKPTGYWRLGEPDGTVMRDSSGNGQDGTYHPQVELGRPGAITGDADTAVRLDDGYAEVPSSSSVSPTGPYTVEAWVRPSAIRPDPGTAIVEKYTGPAKDGFALRLDGNGRLQAWNLGASSYAFVTGKTSVSTGKWHHVAAVFDGSNLTVYLDGWADGTVATSVAPTAGPASLKIGGRGDDSAQRWQGDLDEVALYPGALSADRIATHYLTGN